MRGWWDVRARRLFGQRWQHGCRVADASLLFYGSWIDRGMGFDTIVAGIGMDCDCVRKQVSRSQFIRL